MLAYNSNIVTYRRTMKEERRVGDMTTKETTAPVEELRRLFNSNWLEETRVRLAFSGIGKAGVKNRFQPIVCEKMLAKFRDFLGGKVERKVGVTKLAGQVELCRRYRTGNNAELLGRK